MLGQTFCDRATTRCLEPSCGNTNAVTVICENMGRLFEYTLQLSAGVILVLFSTTICYQNITPFSPIAGEHYSVNEDYALISIQRRLNEFDAKQKIALSERNYHLKAKNMWFLFEPEVPCVWEERVGPIGDGAKWVCTMPELERKLDCLVLSFGSAGEDDFEREVSRRTRCVIHIFDPSPAASDMHSRASQYGANFHALGLGDGKTSGQGLWRRAPDRGVQAIELPPLSSILEKVNLTSRRIDVLKVDIEGHEFSAFDLAFSNCKLNIGEILLEVHWCPAEYEPCSAGKRLDSQIFYRIESLFSSLRRCGYVIFHKEPNLQGCDGWRCIEYAFINRTLLESLYDRFSLSDRKRWT